MIHKPKPPFYVALGLAGVFFFAADDAMATPYLSEREAWPPAVREAGLRASYKAYDLGEPWAVYEIALRRRNARNRVTFGVDMVAGPHSCSFRVRVRQYRRAKGIGPDAMRPGAVTTHTYVVGKIVCS